MKQHNATLEQIVFNEIAFSGKSPGEAERLESDLQDFVKKGILKLDGDRICFGGDDFDRIYSKYNARQRGVNIANAIPAEALAAVRFRMWLEDTAGLKATERVGGRSLFIQAPTALKFLENLSDESNASQLFESYPLFAEDIYWEQIEQIIGNRRFLLMGVFEISSDYLNAMVPYYLDAPLDLNQRRIGEAFRELKERTATLGATIGIHEKTIDVLPLERLTKYVQAFAPKYVRDGIIERHGFQLVKKYSEEHDVAAAGIHASALAALRSFATIGQLNNLGYYYLAQNSPKEARSVLEAALEKAGPREEQWLPRYNLAVALLRSGEIVDGKVRLASLCAELDDDKYAAACLFVPIVIDGDLVWQEEYDIKSVLQVVRAAQKAVGSLMSSGS